MATGHYRVLNQTRATAVAESCERADSFLKRGVGLLGRTDLEPGTGLIIEPCKSIHMFFMRFPIDAAFLDENDRVCHMLHSIRPWRASRYVRRARKVIELPAGTLRATVTENRDQIIIEPE